MTAENDAVGDDQKDARMRALYRRASRKVQDALRGSPEHIAVTVALCCVAGRDELGDAILAAAKANGSFA